MGKGEVDDLLDQPGKFSLFIFGDSGGTGKVADGLETYSANCNVEIPGVLLPGTGDRQ